MDSQTTAREQVAPATPFDFNEGRDPTLMLLEQQYDRVLRRYGIPIKVPGQARPPMPEDAESIDLKAALVELEPIVDAIAFHIVDLAEHGKRALPPRDNNPFSIARMWIKEHIFGFKPGLNVRIWREVDRRDAMKRPRSM